MPLMNSTELIQKLNEHRNNIGKSKATYQEGFLYGYGLLAKEYLLLLDIISDFESRNCESCKWYIDNVCCNRETYLVGEILDKDFGCNQWRKKQ